MAVLAREVARQVTPDGVSREQSTGYQRFVLDFCRQVVALARKTGRHVPPVLHQRTAAMAAFLALLGGESAPPIGDSDDGRALPFPEAESNWWLGLPPPQPFPPQTLPRGGYCYWEAGDLASVFDVGPLGLWPNASHGHADALSILIRVKGRWLLGDPGTGAYEANPEVRNALRGTPAHNTVAIDGLDQSDPLDTFKWLHPVESRLIESHTDDRCHYALAMHEGYRRLPEPVTHYRGVLFVHPPGPGWIVMDRLAGQGRHHCALRFHFPPGIELHPEGSQSVMALDPAAQVGLRLDFSEPGWRVESGLWSPRFGCWETAPVVVLERTATMPVLWFTFLTPIQ